MRHGSPGSRQRSVPQPTFPKGRHGTAEAITRTRVGSVGWTLRRLGFASIVPRDADVSAVAEVIAKLADTPFGKRPFRVQVDPMQDGAEVVNMVLDRVRAELLRRIGLADVLTPRALTPRSRNAT